MPRQEKLEQLLSKTIQGLVETTLLSVSYWKKILSVWAFVILPLWIDTKDGLSDFLPVKDWFNEMHAKNTSKKVRAVFQNKGMSGKPLTTVIRRTKPSLSIG